MALVRVWVVGSQTHLVLPSADRVLVEISVGQPAYPVASWWLYRGTWRSGPPLGVSTWRSVSENNGSASDGR